MTALTPSGEPDAVDDGNAADQMNLAEWSWRGSPRCFLRILDEDDSPQRYPLVRLLDAVRNVVDPDQQDWRMSGVWGQGLKTVRFQNELRELGQFGEINVSTEELLGLDDDPDEWFFDVVIRTSDRSLAFGIFDSGCMFVEGPRAQVIEIGNAFDDVIEQDPEAVPPAIRGVV